MKLKHQAPKGQRINYNFMGFTTYEDSWFYNLTKRGWEKAVKSGNDIYSTFQPCKTLKAFRRKLKTAPKGIRFVLVSRWTNNDVIGINNKQENNESI